VISKKTFTIIITSFSIIALCSDTSYAKPAYVRIKRSDYEIIITQNSLSQKRITLEERAVLKGLLWCVRYFDKNHNFNNVFSDYLTMLYEVSIQGSPVVKDITKKIAQKAIKRAYSRLGKIFSDDLEGKWDFINIIPILNHFEFNLQPFAKFYRNYFPKDNSYYEDLSFRKATRKHNYDVLSDYIIDYSALYFARKVDKKNQFNLPKCKFKRIVRKCRKIPFKYKFGKSKYHDQNYYATHLVFALCGYGENNLRKTRFTKKIFKYLKKNFKKVRYEVGDIDLLCEYVNCFKIYGYGNNRRVKEAIQYIFSKQLPDGSWDPYDYDNNAKLDAYDIFHPTWTAITALCYKNNG
jgi:hypothetical protein